MAEKSGSMVLRTLGFWRSRGNQLVPPLSLSSQPVCKNLVEVIVEGLRVYRTNLMQFFHDWVFPHELMPPLIRMVYKF